MADYKAIFSGAWKLRNQGQYHKVEAIVSEHLPEAEAQNDLEGLSYLLKLKAQIASDQDRHQEALSTYKRLEKVFIALGNEERQRHTLRHIGQSFLALGKADCAEKCLVQVVEANDINQVHDMEKANTYHLFAKALDGMGKVAASEDYRRRAEAIYKKHGIQEA